MLVQYQVDAFTARAFAGNPAAVCPLEHWLDDELLQAIAAENNLSETAFFVASGQRYALRWFTPTTEVDLCGHATLAAAHVLFDHLGYPGRRILFDTNSGELAVERRARMLQMDFPARPAERQEMPPALMDGLGIAPAELWAGDDYLAVFDDEAAIRALTPEPQALATLDRRGVIVTAPGDSADFVSRFFAPKAGITEDPVTGSAHCALTPFWAHRLGKHRLTAWQVSRRGGEIECELSDERVLLAGHAVTFMEGRIFV